mmetsp:Transcript_11505/g.20050  ORF Transcript_11505/g.20050 Transcript_11505/m.20050 type:complete len:305 (-) Transcript_11505:1833-2747(-)
MEVEVQSELPHHALRPMGADVRSSQRSSGGHLLHGSADCVYQFQHHHPCPSSGGLFEHGGLPSRRAIHSCGGHQADRLPRLYPPTNSWVAKEQTRCVGEALHPSRSPERIFEQHAHRRDDDPHRRQFLPPHRLLAEPFHDSFVLLDHPRGNHQLHRHKRQPGRLQPRQGKRAHPQHVKPLRDRHRRRPRLRRRPHLRGHLCPHPSQGQAGPKAQEGHCRRPGSRGEELRGRRQGLDEVVAGRQVHQRRQRTGAPARRRPEPVRDPTGRPGLSKPIPRHGPQVVGPAVVHRAEAERPRLVLRTRS